jgi:demethoxyubiquinone hydroxylase (CLK1/Coq7/Cat5 family)
MLKKLVNIPSRNFTNFKVPKYRSSLSKSSSRLAHPLWSLKDAEKVEISHYEPKAIRDRVAYALVKGLRSLFDFLTKYKEGHTDEYNYLKRCVFLETVAGVPGMVAGPMRHMRSLRTLKRDAGWIHYVLEEAENERVHLFTFLKITQPTFITRMYILFAQGIFLTGFTTMYLLSSRTAHRFVGYLEEEAVKTYTHMLEALDSGKLPSLQNLSAHQEAIEYWDLPSGSMFRDVLLSIRADEVMHREVNHHLANLKPSEPVEGEKNVMKDVEQVSHSKEEKK